MPIARSWRHIIAGDDGVVMLEFLLAFPLVLTLIFAVVQFSHLWVARQIVHYAAYCAARSMLVVHADEYEQAGKQAAIQVCKWIAIGKRSDETDSAIPGYGTVPGSGGVGRKTRVECESEEWLVGATVNFDFALITPIVGPMLAWAMNPWDNEHPWQEDRGASGVRYEDDALEFPHITISETVWLPKPFVTITKMGMLGP